MTTVRVGVLGCGNVGAPLVELIAAQRATIAARTGLELEVARIAVRDLSQAAARSRCPPIGSPTTPARSSTTPTSTWSWSSSAASSPPAT